MKYNLKRERAIAAKHTTPEVEAFFADSAERDLLTLLVDDSVKALLEVFHKHLPSGTASLTTVGLWLTNLPVIMAELALEGRPAAEWKMLLGSLSITISACIEDKLGRP